MDESKSFTIILDSQIWPINPIAGVHYGTFAIPSHHQFETYDLMTHLNYGGVGHIRDSSTEYPTPRCQHHLSKHFWHNYFDFIKYFFSFLI